MRKFSRKTITIVAGMALVVATSVVAYAFWTNTGAGEGEATTGNNTVKVNQLSTPSGLIPGGDPAELSGDFDNLNTDPVHVNHVTAEISGVDGGSLPGVPLCTAADFELTGNPTLVDDNVPSGAGVGAWDGIFIGLLNTADNQDNCKNATVHLSYSTD